MDSHKYLRIRRWCYWIVGFFAFLWILLRTGTNPKRITYPCQKAAFPVAISWLLTLIAFFGGSLFFKKLAKFSKTAILLIGIIWFTGVSPERPRANVTSIEPLPVWKVDHPISTVFVMDRIPPTTGSLSAGNASVPDKNLSDPAIDTLFAMMETQHIHLFRTTIHPSGIVGADNIVIIKGNFQWTGQNTTSTDRIKGLIWQILHHPDGFSGEILICDNTQDIGTGINENDNNSEDPDQSIVDVVNTFYAKGYSVYCLDWKSIWSAVTSEYADGDYDDGYVYESSTKISYPKFRSPSKNYYISMRYGIWDSVSTVYNSSRLCIIDFPVLKAHSMAGTTIAVKNWIGTLTTAYANQRYGDWSSMHHSYLFGNYALVARVMAVTFPALTIVDATWTTTYGPTNLDWIENTRTLVASTDPVASSWYASKFILTPIARYPNTTNPDLPESAYHNNLNSWTTYLQNSGFACTKDSSQISVYDRKVLTSIEDHQKVPVIGNFRLDQNYPNPFNPVTSIRYSIPKTCRVTVRIFNTLGQEVSEPLVDMQQKPGTYEVHWNAYEHPSGIYFYSIQAGNWRSVKRMLLLK